jgi:hypothetical protein
MFKRMEGANYETIRDSLKLFSIYLAVATDHLQKTERLCNGFCHLAVIGIDKDNLLVKKVRELMRWTTPV